MIIMMKSMGHCKVASRRFYAAAIYKYKMVTSHIVEGTVSEPDSMAYDASTHLMNLISFSFFFL